MHMARIAVIGFGEAAQAFAQSGWHAFDLADRHAACRASGVTAAASSDAAVAGARLVLSLVTADAALEAARAAARSIAPGALFLDMNSVAPMTKRAAAEPIETAGGRYVDVAIMAPVHPLRRAVPLLVSGPHARAAADALTAQGFGSVAVAGDAVGQASSIKLIRSVMVKGVEALTAEMMAAADAAGVSEAVLASLGDGWRTKADYNLERMATHGARRAAEMEEAARTLEALGIDPVMTRGTIVRQRAAAAATAAPDRRAA
jgi:3-hydroxyisobutyrate dehydrogenase-like beta-hydroxyacid dehydrogenase